ncbi:hypothetical protein ATCV1_z651R [Acanthocystis turfacea chlorella virus 1]|uniref:Uncharacterized protein z651R n=1 Tax=Chlorovirus heliozoae TaxID=322019 RepID=A7K9R1_9PHYC|nr:hypothetical protein ATCV1_z651R [Acanthocystis turfacea chlorella virus 1]ABT16785.1 hypothetical protein ATCV1_z651R [Acanthocystis turfacea chlorella virus 1]
MAGSGLRDHKHCLVLLEPVVRLSDALQLVCATREVADDVHVFGEHCGYLTVLHIVASEGASGSRGGSRGGTRFCCRHRHERIRCRAPVHHIHGLAILEPMVNLVDGLPQGLSSGHVSNGNTVLAADCNNLASLYQISGRLGNGDRSGLGNSRGSRCRHRDECIRRCTLVHHIHSLAILEPMVNLVDGLPQGLSSGHVSNGNTVLAIHCDHLTRLHYSSSSRNCRRDGRHAQECLGRRGGNGYVDALANLETVSSLVHSLRLVLASSHVSNGNLVSINNRGHLANLHIIGRQLNRDETRDRLGGNCSDEGMIRSGLRDHEHGLTPLEPVVCLSYALYLGCATREVADDVHVFVEHCGNSPILHVVTNKGARRSARGDSGNRRRGGSSCRDGRHAQEGMSGWEGDGHVDALANCKAVGRLVHGLRLDLSCRSVGNGNLVGINNRGHLAHLHIIGRQLNRDEACGWLGGNCSDEGMAGCGLRDHKHRLALCEAVVRLSDALHLVGATCEVADDEDTAARDCGDGTVLHVVTGKGACGSACGDGSRGGSSCRDGRHAQECLSGWEGQRHVDALANCEAVVRLVHSLRLDLSCRSVGNGNLVGVGNRGHLANLDVIGGQLNRDETCDRLGGNRGDEGMIRSGLRDHEHGLTLCEAVVRLSDTLHLVGATCEVADDEDTAARDCSDGAVLHVVTGKGACGSARGDGGGARRWNCHHTQVRVIWCRFCHDIHSLANCEAVVRLAHSL